MKWTRSSTVGIRQTAAEIHVQFITIQLFLKKTSFFFYIDPLLNLVNQFWRVQIEKPIMVFLNAPNQTWNNGITKWSQLEWEMQYIKVTYMNIFQKDLHCKLWMLAWTVFVSRKGCSTRQPQDVKQTASLNKHNLLNKWYNNALWRHAESFECVVQIHINAVLFKKQVHAYIPKYAYTCWTKRGRSISHLPLQLK